MQHYRKTSHSVYDLKCHFVFTTKYRKSILRGEVAERMRELIRIPDYPLRCAAGVA